MITRNRAAKNYLFWPKTEQERILTQSYMYIEVNMIVIAK